MRQLLSLTVLDSARAAVDEIDAGHLHLVVDPAGVTDRLLRLLDRLGVVGG
jgi:hypothetical protein